MTVSHVPRHFIHEYNALAGWLRRHTANVAEITSRGFESRPGNQFFSFFTLSLRTIHIRLAARHAVSSPRPSALCGSAGPFNRVVKAVGVESTGAAHVGSNPTVLHLFLLFAPWYILVLLIGALRLLFASSGKTPKTG